MSTREVTEDSLKATLGSATTPCGALYLQVQGLYTPKLAGSLYYLSFFASTYSIFGYFLFRSLPFISQTKCIRVRTRLTLL